MISRWLLLVTCMASGVVCWQRSAPYNRDDNDATSNVIKSDEQQHCGCHMVGPSGPPGIPGVPGLHGSRGQDGYKGEKGDIGSKGDIGLPGVPGKLGPSGPQGEKGKRGNDGEKGLQGSQGDRGEKGERGYTGFAGLKGNKGEPPPPGRHVAFSVARSQKLGPVLQDTPVTFDVIFTNVGDSFETYSSHFVCHINGTYMFTAHVLSQDSKNVFAWLMMNDRHRAPLHGDGRNGYGSGSQTIILTLRQEDHVWIQLSKDSALLNDYTTFSGFLLFED